jgi:hypothetical protein
MKFRIRQDYPTSLEHLWAAFGRVDYPKQKYRALGSKALKILRFEVTERRINVELERKTQLVAERIPKWASTLIGGEQRIHHCTQWSRVSPIQVDAELDIAPVNIALCAHATGTVVELNPKQTRMTLNFDVQCAFPTFGATVARLFADQVKVALKADHAFTLAYLEAAEHNSR